MGLNQDLTVVSEEELKCYFDLTEESKIIDPKASWYDLSECDICDGSVGDHFQVWSGYKLHEVHDYMLWRFGLKHGYDGLMGKIPEVIEVLEKDIPFIRDGKPLENLVIPEGYEHGFEGFHPNTALHLDEIRRILLVTLADKDEDHLVIYCGE